MISDTRIARFTAGQRDTTVVGSIPISSLPGVIYRHSGAGASDECLGSVFEQVREITRAFTHNHFRVFSPTSLATFGNTIGQDRTSDAYVYSLANGAAVGPSVLFGMSMGTLECFKYAASNPLDVACIVTFLTICDLRAVYAQDVGGNQTIIANAYGVTAPNPLPANASPMDAANIAALNMPILMYYSGDDIWSQNITSFATSLSQGIANNVGNLGHTNASLQAVPLGDIISFVRGAID